MVFQVRGRINKGEMFMSYDSRSVVARRHLSSVRPKSRAALALGTLAMAFSLVLGLGVAGTAGAKTVKYSHKPILLGISVPLTGPVGSSCGPMNQGMLAYFNYVNSNGGVLGSKIKVDNRDDAYSAAEAVVNTNAFISEHVLAVTGQCGSLQVPAQMPLLDAAKIPFLFVFGGCSACSSDPMFWNLMPSYGSQLAAEIPWIFQHEGVGSVSIMNDTTADSATTTALVTAAVQKAGGTVVGSYSAPAGTSDWSPYVLQMQQTKPDYVVLDQTPQDAAAFTIAMAAQQFAPAISLIGSSAISQAAFLGTISKAFASQLIVTSDVIAPAYAANTVCGKILTQAQIPISGVTLRGCGAAQVDVAVLKKAKQLNKLNSAGIVSVLKSMKNVTASGIYPPLSFSASQHTGVSKLFVFGVTSGRFVQIGQLGS